VRILVTGAYGLIGAACLARLHRGGHELVGAGRGRALVEARLRFPYARWIAADFTRFVTPDAWRPLLAGIDAVVNCVGVLQDDARDDLRSVHVDATAALFEACAAAGIRRVIHVSAIGAEPEGPTAFARTKAEAEMRLAALDLDWVVLRPGLVLASNAYGGSAMLRGLAGWPWVTPVVGADSRIQVVSVDDVADTVAFCLTPASAQATKVSWDLVHPARVTLVELVQAIRRWHGFAPQPVLRLPDAAAAVVARVADGLGRLGWRSPARSTAMAQLTAGVIGDPARWIAATGIQPKSLDDILAARPAGVQDRWFARLYWLKPIAIAALALFWIASGLIALGPARASALVQLAAAGLPDPLAAAALAGSAGFDIALGLAVMVRRFTRLALLLMLATTLIYLVAGSALAPALWADPLGPLPKLVPVLLATLFTLAILDER
jgi:uncharacterized protein YbjT (DUF2867 family)